MDVWMCKVWMCGCVWMGVDGCGWVWMGVGVYCTPKKNPINLINSHSSKNPDGSFQNLKNKDRVWECFWCSFVYLNVVLSLLETGVHVPCSVSCMCVCIYVRFDHINRNTPVLIRTPQLTRFEPA